MRRLAKRLTSEEAIIVFLSLILLCFSYGPLVYQYLFPPPGKVFLGSFGFPSDFFGNVIYFQDGRLGHWQHISRLTSTVIGQPTFIKLDYIVWGQLSRLFPVNPIVFYHIIRFSLSLTLLLLSYFIIGKIFKSKILRISAFLLAFFSTSAGPNSANLVNYWTPISVFQRTAYYPHYLLSFILVLVTILFLNKVFEQRKLKFLVAACAAGFLTSLVHSPNTIILFIGLPFYFILLLSTFEHDVVKKHRELINNIFYLLLFGLIASLPLLYLNYVTSFHPWNLLSKVDFMFTRSKVISPIELLAGIGPTSILAFVGALIAVKSKKNLNQLLAPWSITYIIGFFLIYRIIHSDGARFLQTPFYIILGILSIFTLIEFVKKTIEKFKLKINPDKLVLLLTLVILFVSYPAYKQAFQINRQNFTSLYPYLNASKELKKSLDWLSTNSPAEQIILTGAVDGSLISAFTAGIPYYSEGAGLLDNFSQLKQNTEQFYSQNWTDKQAHQFVKKEKIKWILFSEEERNISGGKSRLEYSFLEPMLIDKDVILYKIR